MIKRLKYAVSNQEQLIRRFQDQFINYINSLRKVLIAKRINNQIKNNTNIIDLLKIEFINYLDNENVINRIFINLSTILNLHDSYKLEKLYQSNKQLFINSILTNEFLWKFVDKNFEIIDNANKLIDIFNNDRYKKYFNDQLMYIAATKYIQKQLLNMQDLQNAKDTINSNIKDINNIKKLLYQDLIQIFDYNNFFINEINNIRLREKQFILYSIDNNNLQQFITYILNKLDIIDIFKKQISNVDIDKIVNKLKVARITSDLSKINLKIGESIDVDGELLHYMTHDISFLPLVYINGNVIFGNQNEISQYGFGRVHHSIIFNRYFQDEKLHINDIQKQSIDNWQQYNGNNFDDIRKYHGVRAVQKDNTILLIDGGEFTEEATNAIYNRYKNTILSLNDNALSLTRTAKRLLKNI